MRGYIKLFRPLLNKHIFHNEKLLKVWVWCLLKAYRYEKEDTIGFQKVVVNPGEFPTGRFKAAEELRMKPSTAWRYLTILKDNQSINIKTNSKFSIISVVNWDIYQDDNGKVDNNPDSKLTTNGQQVDTKEKYKKYNKDLIYRVFEFWNSKGIIKHRELTQKMESAINARLILYTEEELITAITNYADIVISDKHYFNHKWTLQEFMIRGLEKFKTESNPFETYLIRGRDKSTTPGQAPKPMSDEEKRKQKNREARKRLYMNG